ncbi:hypothetical protein [Aquabacterium sp.]|uniref:hypothetical protein n=1 Tax=Aquabacterium sp. TaxID=1872578 RepID=UPI002CC57A07|nr:hypothetical protein [Aquabacterium sp.]HSW09241.1 hypothetical protein [Aquabacterium sp.]
MNAIRTGLALLACCAALGAPAASFFEFGVWMRALDQHSVEVQRSLGRRDAEAARGHARRIEQLYAQLEVFYAQDGRTPDALEISRDGKALAAGIGPLLDRQDFQAATDAAVRLARACNDCHDNHKPLR